MAYAQLKPLWILDARTDICGLLAPLFVAPLFAALVQYFFPNPEWILFGAIVAIDVAHVYATFFRSYGYPTARIQLGPALWFLPIVSLFALCVAYQGGATWFWRLMAYVAAFHFVKQQYGIYMLYRHKNHVRSPLGALEKIIIYGATVVPLVYWHFASERSFQWFMGDDFFHWDAPFLAYGLIGFYVLALLLFFQRHLRFTSVNPAQLFWLAGTLFSWWISIVFTNNDVMFTLCNVLGHGIPYLVLVFHWQKPEIGALQRRWLPIIPHTRLGTWITFGGFCLLFAFVEEGLWDGLVWTEHLSWFPWAKPLTVFANPLWMPLLAWPQLLHYILDARLWRLRPKPHTLEVFR